MKYGYRLYEGSDGKLHLDQIFMGQVVGLKPAPEDAAKPRGYYDPKMNYLGEEEPPDEDARG